MYGLQTPCPEIKILIYYEYNLVELPAGGFVVDLHEARFVLILYAVLIDSVVHNGIIY
jgi:hypothetical protein